MRIENLRRIVTLLALAVAANAEEAGGFAGKWKGEQEGKTYLLLSIAAGSPFKITFATAHIHVGESGLIDEIDGPVENEEKVIESKLENGVLYFKTEQDNGFLMEYRLSLEQGGEVALLRIADAPEFVKPFRLKRA
jgi:hypothetical protein